MLTIKSYYKNMTMNKLKTTNKYPHLIRIRKRNRPTFICVQQSVDM